ncbi:heme biosynthesis protein HemY [Pararhizobium sp.]|uniref:heme biosynthesis protein HemY n=1 Tax=Pararhizobium sp. TaxID=1977563 RepID=UPI002723C1BB|nr:heme biosynthesis protein HemY [Pararhizobium sp.]MDO9416539.1 heme biosynthesis protein HemY [Pararhizobium sp.]
MVRILVFILLVLALGTGFAWLADRPGELAVTWQGRLYEMELITAATAFVALLVAVLLTLWIVRVVWTSPQSVTRFFRARKRDRGYQALSTGLIAAGAGDAVLARKMSARTKGLLRADQEPLMHLLEAQAALIEGRHDEARKKFEAMADDPETRELGLRGLYLEAKRLGANEAARQYAERAADKAPHLSWAALATLDHRSQTGQWDEAIRLLDQSRLSHVIDKPEADRKKAVLLTARAHEKLEADPKGARDDALAALKLSDTLVPAALIAAKALFREDNLRKGASVLDKVWRQEPHPEIGYLYVLARSGDSAMDRLKRAEKLEGMKPNNAEALAIVAQAALDARQLPLARAKAEAAARLAPRESVFLLLADIEEADTGDQGRIRHWLNQALKAPRDPAWTADGITSPDWLPVSPVTGRLDAFEWKQPVSQIAGPVEDGSIDAGDAAIRSLPPVTRSVEPIVVAETKQANPEPAKQPLTIEAEKPLVKAVEVPVKAVEEEVPAVPVIAAKPKEQSKAETVVEPFFGRPPDDPGVRAGSKPEEKANFRLF